MTTPTTTPASDWISVDDRLPERNYGCLVTCVALSGKRYVCAARYCDSRTVKLHGDCDPYEGCEYDESDDDYYVPAGWYETEHVDDCAPVYAIDPVVAWMKFPEPYDE